MGGFVTWLRAEWDRAAGVGFLVAGATCLVVGYSGVAGSTYVPQALSFIASGGFFGLLLVAVGATLLITAALHDEWRKLDRIEQAIDRLAQSGVAATLVEGEAHNGSLTSPPGQGECPSTGRGEDGPAPSVSGGGEPDPQPAFLAVRMAGPALPGPLAMTGRPLQASLLTGLVATALVAGGWVATASAVDDNTAYATILLGIGGLAVAGTASAGWTLSLRRAARQRQARLLGPFTGRLSSASTTDLASSGRVAVADGLTRFHVPGCAAMSGLTVRLISVDEAACTGLRPCPLCETGR